MNTFTCAACGKTQETNWTEEQKVAEMKKNWGERVNVDDCESLCYDCHCLVRMLIDLGLIPNDLANGQTKKSSS